MKTRADILITKRLVMRPLEERDREDMLSLLENDKIKKTYMIPDFASRERADAYYDRLMALSRSDAHFIYGICLGGKVIGFLNDCSMDGAEAEVGYFISPEHWGRGYAAEALGEAVRELFRMGYDRVTAGYFEENTASRRVMEKCGMKPLDRESVIEYRGRSHRCLYLAVERRKDAAMKEGRSPRHADINRGDPGA